MTEDVRRFVGDAEEDMAVGIGQPMRFIGFGLLSELREEGKTDTEIWELLPNNGRSAYTREQLMDASK